MRARLLLLVPVLAACAPPAPVVAPSTGISAISQDELRRDLFVFASDSFAGRETGTPNATKAARFIVERLMQLGLEPAGDSLYYQRVPLVREVVLPTSRFGVTVGESTIPLAIGA